MTIGPVTGKGIGIPNVRIKEVDDDAQPLAVADVTGLVRTVLPASGTESQLRLYRGYLGQGGVNVTTDLAVDGSITPKTFRIDPILEGDLFINQLTLLLADSSVRNDRLGDIPTSTVTTGIDITVTQNGDVQYLASHARTGGHLIAEASGINSLGQAAAGEEGIDEFVSSHQIRDFNANSDALLITFNLTGFLRAGVRLGRGTTDKIELTVNDNLTGLDFGACSVSGQVLLNQADIGETVSPGRGPDYPV